MAASDLIRRQGWWPGLPLPGSPAPHTLPAPGAAIPLHSKAAGDLKRYMKF